MPRPPRVTARGGGGAVPPVSGTFWPAHRPSMPKPRHARPDVGGVQRTADGHDGQWLAGRCGQRGPRRPQKR